MTDLSTLATRVDDAARNATAMTQLSGQGHALSLTDAYRVQQLSIARRLQRGETWAGIKLGFTSRAKMLQMGVDDLIWGQLTREMMVGDGDTISLAPFIHPRIEPEIAFLLGKPLQGKVTLVEAMSAVEAICPALEIIDSRYADFRFSLEDVVADNASSSGFVLGSWHRPDLAIDNLGMVMEFNGRAVQIGSSAAILGNPYRSLVEAARLADEAGLQLEAGTLILAGAATAAEPLQAGVHVRLKTQQLGTVELSVSP
ncbi:2-keto-4-pentenoate hydratase [Oceanisphaera sp. KMM 10153]|uniref:2-keto-4-pentenoate hydratase n=1 Tax=Oceanisphaera submarina TaxID=3390193 RepID=UPI00397560FF